MQLELLLLRNFAIALLIGALIGVEREKKKERDRVSIGGLRTFILIAEAGALAAWLSERLDSNWLFAAVGGGLVALLVIGYLAETRAIPAGEDRDDVGMTTEAAALVTYLLGGATLFGFPEVAVALAIVTSALLALKAPLHGLVRQIGQEDMVAGLKLLFATFIVLPLLPNEPVDPWGALNPYKLWWLVILISGLSLAGYIAVRLLGQRRGTALTGIFGGLVSSTAVTLSFARRTRTGGEAGPDVLANALAVGILLAWAIMFVRVLVEVAVVHLPMLVPVLIPMVAMGAVTAGASFHFFRRSGQEEKEERQVELRNPFNLWSAITFGLFFAVILLLVELTREYLPESGIYVVAGLAGMTDVDAITLSMAQYAGETGRTTLAVRAVVIAVLSNTVVKCGMVVLLGRGPLRKQIAIATALILATGVASMLLV